ncbi:MAG: hypothetical protein PHG00_05700 [Methylococcales bacterium]|nr:hypothetical protein [Methylococcales bacterium]
MEAATLPPIQAITIINIPTITEVIATVILFLDLITVTGIMAAIEAVILFMGDIMDTVVLFMDDIMAMAAMEEDSETAGITDMVGIIGAAFIGKSAPFLYPMGTRCIPTELSACPASIAQHYLR